MQANGFFLTDCERIIQLAPVSIMCFDAAGDITFVNDWHLSHFAQGRRDREYFLGRNLLDLPGIASSGIAEDLRAILEGRDIHLESVYAEACSGGQAVYQNIRGIPVVEDGRVTGGILIREDVTGLVLAQKLLAENQTILKTLLDATRDSIILSDPDGVIEVLNEEAARRRGRALTSLVGASLYEHLSPEQAQLRRRHVRLAVETRGLQVYEERNGDFWYQVSICPIADDAGQVRSLASYSRDITRLKVTENQLIKEKDLAFSASQAKTQFLGNVTHELRTPLNGIIGACQLALGEPGPGADDSELWRIVDVSGKRLLGVVNNVLELADIDAAALEPTLVACDVRAMLDSLARAYGMRAKLKELALSVTCDPRIPDRLVGDIHRVRQVLSNLLDNALRCTTHGSIRVKAKRIRSKRMRFAGNYTPLLFSVRDTGLGIPKSRQERIFEEFELAEPYLTKRVSGAGLGLSISRHLVEMLGGRIWVKSTPGVGSAFHCVIPFALPEPEGRQAAEVREPVAEAAFAPGRYTVLLVEDEAINRLTTGRTLERLGYRVLEAVNGQEALAVLAGQPADCILMDIQMPVMDGIACAHHIRNGEVPGQSKRVPIIALTAYASERDREKLLRLGMDDYLAKPHSMEQLRAVLETALAGRGPVTSMVSD